MDKQTARALGLGAALFLLRNVAYPIRLLYAEADRFMTYILTGQWPKEAVDQLGREDEEGKGSKEGPHATL